MFVSRPPLDDEHLDALVSAHPQPLWSHLLGTCPFTTNADGSYTALHMADVVALNRHPEVRGPGGRGPSMGGVRPLHPADLDGPEHTKYRRVLNPVFAKRTVAVLEPRIAARADDVLDGLEGRPGFDVYAEYCEPLPSSIFLEIMGLPQSDLDFFLDFKRGLFDHPLDMPVPEVQVRMRTASTACYAYFDRMLDERPDGQRGDDLVSWLLDAEVDGRPLTREELLDIFYPLIIAGLDTVGSSLATMIGWLADHPAERRRLVEDPALWPQAIEELLRVLSPVAVGFRFPQVDVEVEGGTLPAGSVIMMAWPAANLDPAVFEDPLEVDFDRAKNPHVAFGSGFHRCLGDHLARLELRVAMERFHARFPDYAVEPSHEVRYNPKLRKPLNGIPLLVLGRDGERRGPAVASNGGPRRSDDVRQVGPGEQA